MAFKIGYTAALGWRDRPAREVAAQLRSVGCESVEWPGHRFDPRLRTTAEMAAVVRDTTAEGLEISSVAFHRDLIGADAEARRDKGAQIAEMIRAVAGQGIPRGNIWAGPAAWAAGEPRLGKDLAEGAAWEQVFATLDELVRVAEQERFVLTVEPLFACLVKDYYTARVLLERYPSPYFGLTLDPSHTALAGNDTAWVIRQLGDRVKHVQLKDVAGRPGTLGETFFFPLIGEGIVDWPAVFAALEETGYAGHCSLEFESFNYFRRVLKGDPLAAARLSMESLRAMLDQRGA
jgi:sugar phosphate isomerase/epimerase